MATYISLINWTEQGIRNVKESPKRLEAVRQMIKDAGGELKSFYLTMGPYDLVSIVDAPSDEVIAKILLTLGASGNVRTVTLKAFGEAEYRKIVSSVG